MSIPQSTLNHSYVNNGENASWLKPYETLDGGVSRLIEENNLV
jgi:hypothetical protein